MKIAVLCLVGLFIAGASFVAGKRYYFSHSGPKDDYQEKYWTTFNYGRVTVFETLPIDTGDIVFVGNSITEGFPLQEMFHSLKVKNRGICGNQSWHILARIVQVAKCRPAKIFLDVGINDILNGKSIDSLKMRYEAIVDGIREYSPETSIFIQSVFPVGISQKIHQPTVDEFDAWLRIFCRAQHLMYIDLRPAFEKDGYLNPEFTYDDIHLTGKGYAIWKENLQPYL